MSKKTINLLLIGAGAYAAYKLFIEKSAPKAGLGFLGARKKGGQSWAAIPRVYSPASGPETYQEKIKAQWQALYDRIGPEAYAAMVRNRMAARRR